MVDLRANLVPIVDDVIDVGETELRNAALVILGSAFVGRHAIRISKAMRIDRHFCVTVGIRMRSAGRWNNKIYDEWLNDQDGTLQFILDAMVASNQLRCYHGKYYIRQPIHKKAVLGSVDDPICRSRRCLKCRQEIEVRQYQFLCKRCKRT